MAEKDAHYGQGDAIVMPLHQRYATVLESNKDSVTCEACICMDLDTPCDKSQPAFRDIRRLLNDGQNAMSDCHKPRLWYFRFVLSVCTIRRGILQWLSADISATICRDTRANINGRH